MDPVIRDILEVAVAEFAEHGLAGARVDAIAARTRTSKRMLYYHFGSKDGLYAAALAHAYQLARQRVARPATAGLSPLDALSAHAGHVFDVHVATPEFVRLVMGENLLHGRFIAQADSVRAGSLQILQELQEVLSRGQAAGVMRTDIEALDLYANLVGMAFHFVSNRATFSSLFEMGRDPQAVLSRRRAMVVDAIVSQARV